MPKILFQPVKNMYISQYFGENKACVTTDGSNKVISCDGKNPPKGYRSLYGELGHKGLDIPTNHGQEVYHAADGEIYLIDTSAKSGLDVRVKGQAEGVIFRLIYEHLLGYQGKVGDKVKVGDLVGWADNTGYSSGDHLHFQMEIWKDGVWVPANPLLYMDKTFALDAKKLISKIAYLKEVLARLLDNTAYKLRSK